MAANRGDSATNGDTDAWPRDTIPLRMPDKPERLSTWGEIAAFLDCNVRTAQRWAADRGLPVRRVPGGGRKISVFAYRHELQDWLNQNHTVPEPAVAPPAAPSRGVLSRRTALLLSVGGMTVVSASVWAFRPRPRDLARASLVGSSLCAWDDIGRMLWTRSFKNEFGNQDPAADQRGQTVLVADLLADGSKQVLFLGRFTSPDGVTPRHELFCFSSAGKMLWQYKPSISLKFGADSFDGPWRITDMLVRKGRRLVWVALSHATWRPGVVLSIDPAGKAVTRFVSAGNVYALGSIASGSSHYVLAGGVNNEYAAASLAVFEENSPPCTAPQTKGTRFECVDGPRVGPTRYFLFPPTEINVGGGLPYNAVTSILEGSEDSATVVAYEIPDPPSVRAMYGLSDHLEIRDFAFDNNFGVQHRRFERAGQLHHSLDACPLLKGPARVRRWEASSGWTTVDVPPMNGVRPESQR